MDKAELEEYVVQALGKRKGRDEILTYVCEHGGIRWQEAELFVSQVIDKHEPEITRRRKGAIIIFGIIGIIGVIIVVIGIVYATRSRPDPALSERPLCVTLPVYSSVIEQVMGIYPYWSSLQATHDGFESTRRTEDEIGIAYLFDLDEAPTDYTFVYKTPVAILSTRFQYEFRDIELP